MDDKELNSRIKNALSGEANIRKGVWIVKRGYYYRVQAGNSPEALAEGIKHRLEQVGINIEIISATDHWHAWPKDSYFEVRFKTV